MSRFNFHPSKLNGIFIVEPKPLIDQRGYFERLFCIDDFKEIGFSKQIKQINHSYTKQKGAIRGLHFQYPPFMETKIIRCLKGIVFDVAVDVRADSSTYLQWHGEVISADNGRMIYIPEGFAHGFQTLSEDVEMLYFHTEVYSKDHECALHFADPALDIKWKLDTTGISERDRKHIFINDDFKGIRL